MIINLDGRKIGDKSSLHEELMTQGNFPDYYGKNLDALWDLLTDYSGDIEINIINGESLSLNLGNYYNSLVGLLMDLSLEYKNIDFNLEVR